MGRQIGAERPGDAREGGSGTAPPSYTSIRTVTSIRGACPLLTHA